MDKFSQELANIRSEQDFNAFIQRNQNHPYVQKMIQMTKGRSGNEVMGIAENLANASKINFAEFRKALGF